MECLAGALGIAYLTPTAEAGRFVRRPGEGLRGYALINGEEGRLALSLWLENGRPLSDRTGRDGFYYEAWLGDLSMGPFNADTTGHGALTTTLALTTERKVWPTGAPPSLIALAERFEAGLPAELPVRVTVEPFGGTPAGGIPVLLGSITWMGVAPSMPTTDATDEALSLSGAPSLTAAPAEPQAPAEAIEVVAAQDEVLPVAESLSPETAEAPPAEVSTPEAALDPAVEAAEIESAGTAAALPAEAPASGTKRKTKAPASGKERMRAPGKPAQPEAGPPTIEPFASIQGGAWPVAQKAAAPMAEQETVPSERPNEALPNRSAARPKGPFEVLTERPGAPGKDQTERTAARAEGTAHPPNDRPAARAEGTAAAEGTAEAEGPRAAQADLPSSPSTDRTEPDADQPDREAQLASLLEQNLVITRRPLIRPASSESPAQGQPSQTQAPTLSPKFPVKSIHPLAPRVHASGTLDGERGALVVQVRSLPSPSALGKNEATGRPWSAYRAWLTHARTGATMAVGMLTRGQVDQWRLEIPEGLPLHRFDTLLVCLDDRSSPQAKPEPIVLQGSIMA